jgi:hypothetical protein
VTPAATRKIAASTNEKTVIAGLDCASWSIRVPTTALTVREYHGSAIVPSSASAVIATSRCSRASAPQAARSRRTPRRSGCGGATGAVLEGLQAGEPPLHELADRGRDVGVAGDLLGLLERLARRTTGGSLPRRPRGS